MSRVVELLEFERRFGIGEEGLLQLHKLAEKLRASGMDASKLGEGVEEFLRLRDRVKILKHEAKKLGEEKNRLDAELKRLRAETSAISKSQHPETGLHLRFLDGW